MRRARWSDDDRELVRSLRDKNMSTRAISAHTGIPRSTVKDILNGSRESALPPADLLTDAAIDYFIRFGEWPTSVTLNASKAAARGGVTWRRHLEGWVDRQGRWRAWPQPHDMTRRHGSWDDAYPAFRTELARQRERADPWIPRPIPNRKRIAAAVSGYSLDVLRQRKEGSRVEPEAAADAVPVWRGVPAPMPPARERQGLAVIGDHGPTRRRMLAHAVKQDLACPRLAVVVLQFPGRPSVAHGLPVSGVIDIEGVVAAGLGAAVESDDPDVRAAAIAAAADASWTTGRDVSLLIDDAGDVIEPLIRILLPNDTPRLHVSAAWAPRREAADLTLWVMLKSRAMSAIADEEVAEPFLNGWYAVLRDGVLSTDEHRPS
jgi:hypothetical protein